MQRRVALIVETSSAYGRDLLKGVTRYMRMYGEWSVFLEQRDLWTPAPQWLSKWQGDGIISRVTTPTLIRSLAKTEVPLVEVTDRRNDSGMPQVRSDDAAIGRLGAEHLIERGFQRFGFCGFRREAWSRRREQAFAKAVKDKTGTDCARLNSPWHGRAARSWEDEQETIASWLNDLAPPVAVMVCNDIRGQHVLNACSRLNLNVPEQVAVLGVDNDELLCQVSSPPLSSVIPNAVGVGYRAAETLARLMNGNSVGAMPQLIRPLNVAVRQSTDVVAIDDPEIAAALHYIRRHACRGLSVDEVVRHSTVSRSTLERQLRKYLGRTPQEEVRHVQVKRVQELLLTTDLSVEKIAELSGFEHSEYLHVVFKRLTGQTPGEFRKQAQPGLQ